MEDSIHHKQLREELTDSLRAKGISDNKVLEAIRRVPRHLFFDRDISAQEAYKDVAQEIGEGQTISQPYTVAYQTSLLEVAKGQKVLEVGTGSGYQAAVLFELGADLYSIERQKKLYSSAKLRLSELGFGQIRLFFGDGAEGLEQHGPFDRILVTAAAGGIPAPLVDQLTIGGIMVIPVNGKVQKMLKVTRVGEQETNVQEFDNFRFVPLLSGVSK